MPRSRLQTVSRTHCWSFRAINHRQARHIQGVIHTDPCRRIPAISTVLLQITYLGLLCSWTTLNRWAEAAVSKSCASLPFPWEPKNPWHGLSAYFIWKSQHAGTSCTCTPCAVVCKTQLAIKHTHYPKGGLSRSPHPQTPWSTWWQSFFCL